MSELLKAAAPIRRTRITKLVAPLLLSAVLGAALWSNPAHALSFAEAASESSKGGNFTFGQLDEMQGFLAKATSKLLKNVKLSNITADGKGLTGDVSLRGKPWTIIVNSDPAAKSSFVGFTPASEFSFSDLVGKNDYGKLFNTMKLTQPVLFIAVGDVSIASKELPANIKSLLGRLYEKPESFTLDITQGLSLIVKLDMSNATVIDTSIKFMGGKSSTVQLKAEMDMAVIDSMIKVLGAPPSPNLKLSAALPTFRPSIGGHKGGRITLPADIQFTFRVNFFKGGIWLGYDGVTKFKIGKQLIDVTLAQTYHIPSDSSVPYSKTKLSIFEDKPY